MHGGEHLMRSRALFRCQVFEAALEERRFDRSRADAVDANSILGVVHRKRLGQEDHAGLRRAVGGHLARALETGDRRGAQDHAAPLHQLGQRVLAAEENALQIDVDRAIPFLLGEQMRTPGEADPGIVVEDVETAEVAGGLGDHPLGIGGLRYVGANRDRLAAALYYFSPDRIRALLAPVADGDICALGREQQRRGASYSRSAAGDQRDFSLELAHFPFHSVFIRRDRDMVRRRGRALLASSLRSFAHQAPAKQPGCRTTRFIVRSIWWRSDRSALRTRKRSGVVPEYRGFRILRALRSESCKCSTRRPLSTRWRWCPETGWNRSKETVLDRSA